MKKQSYLILLFLLPFASFSQSIKCDTLTRYHTRTGKEINYVPTNWQLYLVIGATSYNYDSRTKEYLANHWGPTFKLTTIYKSVLLGLHFRPATINVDRDLDVGYGTLTSDADLNVVKTDITLGYKLDIGNNFVIQPYFGYLRSYFVVINEDEINQSFTFSKSNGITGGMTLNKYFELKTCGQYFGVFLNSNYNRSNYNSVNKNFGDNFFAFEFGVSYGGFMMKKLK